MFEAYWKSNDSMSYVMIWARCHATCSLRLFRKKATASIIMHQEGLFGPSLRNFCAVFTPNMADRRTKGRGDSDKSEQSATERYSGKDAIFSRLDSEPTDGPIKCMSSEKASNFLTSLQL